jgi:transcriptional regulator with XRE-family HTH domain
MSPAPADLAQQASVNRSSIDDIQRGRSQMPNLAKLERIAAALLDLDRLPSSTPVKPGIIQL